MRFYRDSEFIRGNIPMTKEEIRAVVMSKLKVEPQDKCLDIGAGTGSMTITMASAAFNGRVKAVEKESEGIELINANCKNLNITNITVIEGTAPDVLPSEEFNKVFIGGSSGNLRSIIEYVHKNIVQNGIVVLNFVVIENLAEALMLLKEKGFKNIETVQIGVNRARNIGGKNMMAAETDVFIVSAEK